MDRFIPFEKLSKKKQREISAKQRGSWGSFHPVTRKPQNPNAYNRKKARKWSDESPMTVPFIFFDEYSVCGRTFHLTNQKLCYQPPSSLVSSFLRNTI